MEKQGNFLDYNETDFKRYLDYLKKNDDQYYDPKFIERVNRQSDLIRLIALR